MVAIVVVVGAVEGVMVVILNLVVEVVLFLAVVVELEIGRRGEGW